MRMVPSWYYVFEYVMVTKEVTIALLVGAFCQESGAGEQGNRKGPLRHTLPPLPLLYDDPLICARIR